MNTRLILSTAAMSILMLVACGGSGGGSSIEFPGDETAPLNSLTADEMTQVCEAYASKAQAIIVQNKKGTCMMGAMMASMFAEMGGEASGMSDQEFCEMVYDECMTSDTNWDDSDSGADCGSTAANAASCEAPIGEVEACYNDMLSQTKQTFQAFNGLTCSNIGSSGPPSGTSPISEEYPPSCESLKSQCPMFMPN